jgi:hypothetical protein
LSIRLHFLVDLCHNHLLPLAKVRNNYRTIVAVDEQRGN